MPSNDFKPFATGSSANVTDQATFAAASTTTNGFSSGLAKSADVNKVLRQASFVAAAVAQMVADNQSNNVADDGNVANFETNLIAAIRALVPGAFVYSKLGSGYIKFPGTNAPIIQWTTTSTISAGSHIDVAWPTTFPSGPLFALANVIGTSDSGGPFAVAAGVISAGNTTASNARVFNHSGSFTVGNAWVMGIGY